MRVVSLNAWGGRLWEALAAWLPEAGADVLCLQEVTRAPVPSPPDLDYLAGARPLRQRSDLLGDVARRLPGHDGRFVPAVRGPLFDGEGQAWPSENGIACFVRRDVEVVEEARGFVHGAFRADGWGEEPVPRAIQGLRLADGRGATLAVVHLHGLRDPPGRQGRHPGPRRPVRAHLGLPRGLPPSRRAARALRRPQHPAHEPRLRPTGRGGG